MPMRSCKNDTATLTNRVRTIASHIPAIISEVPSLAHCAGAVAQLVREKGGLFPLIAGVSHVNLIVADQTLLLSPLERSAFYRVFCTPELQDSVFGSQFREVFFLTRFKSGRAYVPLKLLLTLGRLFFFREATINIGLTGLTIQDYMATFASYLRSITQAPIGIRVEASGAAELLCGDTGIHVSEGAEYLDTAVRMYHDSPWPADTSDPNPVSLPTELLLTMEQLQTENTFTSEIAFAVASG